MEKWILKNKKADFQAMAMQHDISPVLAKLLVNRDITKKEAVEKFLHGKLNQLYTPFAMKDMEKAADIILEAADRQEKVAIATDYDTDGIMSAYVLKKVLERLGLSAEVFSPDRVAEGYGLNNRIVEEAAEKDCKLLITCDNGIAALEAVEYARKKDLRIIVTDHHEVRFEETENGREYLLPDADAIVDHKQPDCPYPFKELCGAGVVYKLAEVLYDKRSLDKEELYSLLPFVAIATVADVMDLTEENRIIVREGLKRIGTSENTGLQALLEANGLEADAVSAYHIGFVLGPCFNAAGRLETMRQAFDLLECRNREQADRMAEALKELNDTRKDMTAAGAEQAFHLVEETDAGKDNVLVLLLEAVHESLAGIIAGRVKERYHKPVFVFVHTEEGVKGSGRSIEAYNMFEEIQKCADLLSRFGGHPMAAGLTLPEENLELFRQRLNKQAVLTEEDLQEKIYIDAAMPIGYISEELVQELELLEPFGKGNAKPLFAEQHFKLMAGRVLGKNRNVLKMKVINQSGTQMAAVYFGDIEAFERYIEEKFGREEVTLFYQGRTNRIDLGLTYYPSVNEYMGNRSLELVIRNYCVIQGK